MNYTNKIHRFWGRVFRVGHWAEYRQRIVKQRLRHVFTPLLLLISFSAAPAATLPELTITVFAPPSQSIWIPALIEHLELDKKNGFKLTIIPKPSNVAYTDFATGKDDFCYCAAIPAVSRFKQQGAKIALLWNVFNFESDIVLKDPAIKTIADLQGKTGFVE